MASISSPSSSRKKSSNKKNRNSEQDFFPSTPNNSLSNLPFDEDDNDDGAASSVAGSMTSSAALSTSSTYRHHRAFQHMLPANKQNSIFLTSKHRTTHEKPQPVLVADARHKPKTRGTLGLLVVGLGGRRGSTLLAGILANHLQTSWKGPVGQDRTANFHGCTTQQNERFSPEIQRVLADATLAAVGGWDICTNRVGDALLDAQILDYDLVRQLKENLNKHKVFRGLYDERFFTGETKQIPTHILDKDTEASSASEAIKCLRADIRYFKWRNGVVGHTTVLWSATEEHPCELILQYSTAKELLDAVETPEAQRGGPLPPSLLYATAALLEQCSFVDGSSPPDNTLSCRGLVDLARQQLGVYCLGSGFRAGPSQFQSATSEYLSTVGLIPDVKKVNGSRHSMENNQLALVPADVDSPFVSFVSELDDKSYPDHGGAERGKVVVEYKSLGFLGQPHTLVTYTQTSDAILAVPLMIDAAVWCDFFSNFSWPHDKVGRALAHFFVQTHGSLGFFRQVEELRSQAQAACDTKTLRRGGSSVKKKRVRIRPEEKTTEWAIPHDARIICAGLACVDMQLGQATGGDGGEGIETFQGEKSIGGGSVSMACKTLARLCHGAPLDDGFMQVTPPVVHSVVPLCKLGNDDSGNKLISLLEHCGAECRNVDTKYSRLAREQNPSARTALAVLPIYQDGRRGCFFDAASNASFSPDEMIEMIHQLTSGSSGPDLNTSLMSEEDMEYYRDRVLDGMRPTYGAFLFGYPHLLPNMQGDALARILIEAREAMIEGGIVALDLNGVPEKGSEFRLVSDLRSDPVIGAALEHVDILHMNEDELVLLTGCEIGGTEDDEFAIASAASLFLQCGVAIVAVTRGRKGSFVCCNNEARFQQTHMLPAAWFDCSANINAVELPPDTVINTNGAGDSFTAGLLVAAMLRHTGMTVPTAKDSSSQRSLGSESQNELNEQSLDLTQLQLALPSPKKSPKASGKKQTPYQLYMRENYVSLKQQCNDDKKAIFTKCHEMWENETEGVKAFYERKAKEEFEDEEEISIRMVDDIEKLDSTPRGSGGDDPSFASGREEEIVKNMYMTNRALNLESAIQFAGLVAAHHIDMSTRDLLHIDVLRLIERALIVPAGLEEI